MASITTNITAQATVAGTIVSVFSGLKQRFVQARSFRKTVAELSALSNRELADLDLSRDAIYAIARTSVYGK